MPPAAPSLSELLLSLATSLGLGLLVGLQREWSQHPVAGIRTFTLVTILGALCGLLGVVLGGWVLAGAFIAFTALVGLAYWSETRAPGSDSGLTTEMAMLVMFTVGALSMLGYRLAGVIVAGTVMVLLQGKKPLHAMVRRIGEDDLREIARLVLAGLVILPVLPNEPMGYLGVLNPFSIWLMVVLIVGISLAAYLMGKYFDGRQNHLMAGLLGGLISSTATTASLARRSRDAGTHGLSLASVTLIASSFVFVRILVEVAVTAPAHLGSLLPPIAAMMAWFAAVTAAIYWRSIESGHAPRTEKPPSELKSAVLFGLLYAVVLVAVAAARQHLGPSGLYAAAALSGLTDMDAITLSTSRLVSLGQLEAGTGWRMILVGGMANVVFKMILVATLGARSFIRPALAGFAAALLGGIGLLAFWP